MQNKKEFLIATIATTSFIIILILHTTVFLKLVWQQSFLIDDTRYFWLGDDAMISMRYAYNLAYGNGLVWNSGEYVQGITNLGWTLIMVLLHFFGLPLAHTPLLVQLLNLVLNLAIITFVFWYLYRRANLIAGIIAAALLAMDGSLLVQGVGGFETSLQALLITIAFLRIVPIEIERNSDEAFFQNFHIALLLCALAFIIRPDNLVFFGIAGSIALIRRWKDRRLWGAIIIGVIAITSVLIFQRVYYGDWLPNTFHLKVTREANSFSRGLRYLQKFSLQEFYHLPLILGAVFFIGQGLIQRKRALDYLPIGLIVIGWLAYVVAIGGDAFAHGRFFIPVIPVLAVLSGLYIFKTLRRFPHRLHLNSHSMVRDKPVWGHITSTVVQIIVILGLLFLFYKHIAAFQFFVTAPTEPSPHAVEGVHIANTLQTANLPTDSLIAVYYAGITPYFMPNYRFHDMLGKSDRHIARTLAHSGPPGHNKWDYRYSLDTLKTDLIITGRNYRGASDSVFAQALTGGIDHGWGPALWIDDTFKKKYRRNRVNIIANGKVIDAINWVYTRDDTNLGDLTLVRDVALGISQIGLPNSPPLIIIAPSLNRMVGIDPSSVKMPQHVEITSERNSLWLDSNETPGVAGVFWSDANRQIILEFEVSSENDNRGQEHTVELVVNRIDTEATIQKQTFIGSSVLAFPLQFGSGPNYLQFNVVGDFTTDFQASQPPQILLHQVRIQTPPPYKP